MLIDLVLPLGMAVTRCPPSPGRLTHRARVPSTILYVVVLAPVGELRGRRPVLLAKLAHPLPEKRDVGVDLGPLLLARSNSMTLNVQRPSLENRVAVRLDRDLVWLVRRGPCAMCLLADRLRLPLAHLVCES